MEHTVAALFTRVRGKAILRSPFAGDPAYPAPIGPPSSLHERRGRGAVSPLSRRGGGYAGGTLRPMASAWAKESGKDSPRASTPSGCSASGLLQNSATLTLPKDRRALVSLTR